uniref:dephospho-CoA kinase n=1 Tax=Wolbachia endosymbiont of Pentidionis agamae TaxID=3110435 RepID=UPI002FD4718C
YFPDVLINGIIDRSMLSKHFLTYNQNWKTFESIVHVLVLEQLKSFLKIESRAKRKFVILDVPLLLEAKFYLYCDFIIFVHTSKLIQMQRLKKRNLSTRKLSLICDIQLPLSNKKRFSDFTINSGINRGYILMQIEKILFFTQTLK